MKNSIKVLIVDDDRSSSALIGEVVRRMGFKPVITGKATDGLNIAKMQTVHAAIVDVMLPKMSGVELSTEFRKTKFADSPVILVSGVFKDKAFAAEAMTKSGAVDFLFKPYGAEDLMNSLKVALASLLNAEKWSLQSLLMRKFASVRDRSKAIEQLEPIKGHDFPFVLSLLMDARISGNLNLISDGGEIFGVTLSKGTISEVDSTESQSIGVLALISKGFLAQEDWDNFEEGARRKFPLEKLVIEGFVSPHAVSVAKHEQILSDFRTIVSSNTIQLNFVPQDISDDPPKHAVSMKELMKILSPAMDEFFPESYLSDFYKPVLHSPIQLTRPAAELDSVWKAKSFSKWTGLRQVTENSGTLEEAIAHHPENVGEVLTCLHQLVLSRSVVFDDVRLTESLNKLLVRYQDLYKNLQSKSADQVFEYFGGKERPPASACEKMFEDYVRSNHPEQLPKEASEEVIELARKCLDLVSAARVIMTDETKRHELFESLKNEDAVRLKKSNELVVQGLDILRKGQFTQSLEILKEAETLQPTTLQFLIQTWAEIKAGTLTHKVQLAERLKKFDGLTNEEKKSPYFHMALGLLRRNLGDPQAHTSFERVLQIDSGFTEARRELNASHGTKEKKIDLLNGDITDIVSNLFRRKAE